MSNWIRVTARRPCEICGKPDWCGYTDDGASCCMRVTSDRPLPNGGWLHGGGNAPNRQILPRKASGQGYESPDFDAPLWWRSGRFILSNDRRGLDEWEDRLGLPVDSMAWMGATSICRMLCFPMHDGRGEVCGIRTRTTDGQKRAITGSRAGVFLPTQTMRELDVLICEGPTDASAALALDFDPIGRPSCTGQEQHVLDTLRRWGRDRATICADADGPGITGARKLAEMLMASRICVRMVTPSGHKDLRDWYKAGATKEAVDAAWSQARWRM